MLHKFSLCTTRYRDGDFAVVAQVDAAYRKAGAGRSAVRLASYALFEGRPLTTRGRWFNPVVFALSAFLCRFGPKGRVEKPVFIIGTGRTGTTLVGTLLSLHKNVGYLNEPKALWHRVIPDEDVIGSYSDKPGRYWLHESDATDKVMNRFHRLYGAYLAFVRRRRVVDKYPEAIFRTEFIRRVFPDARFIWIVRNGVDTVSSIVRWSQQHGSWWGRDDRKWVALVEQVCCTHDELRPHQSELLLLESDADRAAIEWCVSILQGQSVQAASADCVLKLRYEDLALAPVDQMQRLLRFCELQDDPEVTRYASEQVGGTKHDNNFTLTPFVESFFDQTMTTAGYEKRQKLV